MNKLIVLFLLILVNFAIGVMINFFPELNLNSFLIYHLWFNVILILLLIIPRRNKIIFDIMKSTKI